MNGSRLLACLALVASLAGCRPADPPTVTLSDANRAMKLAVLGDSDSHSYGDRIAFPLPSDRRGGARRSATLQWTEALARLRPGEVDPGAWGVHGTRRAVALARSLAGLDFRTPPEEDFAANFARSGAVCDDLVAWPFGQARELRSLIARDPASWNGAVVVIRIGINDLGTEEPMARFAREGPSPANAAPVARCVNRVGQAIELLEGSGARLRYLIVGILDNAHWPRWHARWNDAAALRNIDAVLDAYDDGLRALAAAGRDRAFLDDRAWFAARWGGRDASGRPAYAPVRLAGGLSVTLTEGDDPTNAVLADGHAGLAWNAMWAKALVDGIREAWGIGPAPITEDEVGELVRRTAGLAP